MTKRKLLGYLSSGLIFFVFLEIALRVYLVHFANESHFRTYASSQMIKKRYRQARMIRHDFLKYVPSSNYANGPNLHNDLGFRGESIDLSNDNGTLRIVCLGASTTYSDGVKDYKESYPYLLQSKLRAKGLNLEVINAGVPGYSSYQSLQNFYLRVTNLKPDYVILYQGFNDLQNRLVWPPEAFNINGLSNNPQACNVPPFWESLSCIRIPLVLLKYSKPHFSINALVQTPESFKALEYHDQLVSGTYPTGIFKEVTVDSMLRVNTARHFEKNTRQLIQLAQSSGTKVVLSTLVYSSNFDEVAPQFGRTEYQQGVIEHNEIIRKLSREFDLTLIDLASTFEVHTDLFTDGIHFTLAGNHQRSELIATVMQELMQEHKAN